MRTLVLLTACALLAACGGRAAPTEGAYRRCVAAALDIMRVCDGDPACEDRAAAEASRCTPPDDITSSR